MGQRVLVVEDEVAIAEAVAARLRSEGYEVDLAHDGPGGIELCAGHGAGPTRWNVAERRAARLPDERCG